MKNEFLITFKKNLKITASVGFVSPDGNLNVYLAIRNKRGWDIPGGRIKENETSLEAFKRELLEETNSKLIDAALVATLESSSKPNTGIDVFCGVCVTGAFAPTEEILEIGFLTAEELVDKYFGDKHLISTLIDLCGRKRSNQIV